ncbi:MAG: ribonuclease HII [Angelakisella sp.]|nr:ribonuclease HII [Angelakisella sp.]
MEQQEKNALWLFDEEAACQAGGIICGVDEAGRGPLAGPVFAACAVFKPGAQIEYLNDSKKLTEKRREKIFEELLLGDKAWFGIGAASSQEIDHINILQATFLAMNRAYEAMIESAGFTPVKALVDGNRDPKLPIPSLTVVKGDGKSAAIAAASVLAKVSRDRYMLQLDQRYPQYQFAKHKGYPTKLHYDLIQEHGVSPVHRVSFLKKLTGEL